MNKTIQMVNVNGVWQTVKKSKVSKALSVGTTVALASFGTMAADHSAAINAAVADGDTNMSVTVVGIIGLAAIMTGVGYVIRMLTSK